ncbi:MAG TPA: glycine zipper 2TM domain-containing protein [Allosphingosinicella sp.]|nr:glycine zipper 2TM domain-containing protein [Allosphingosinicella sp.]
MLLALAPVLATPAVGQSYEEQRRWDAAQARYQAETDAYQNERDRYMRARERDSRGPGVERPYAPPPPPPPPTAYDYDAARDYRESARAEERRLEARDEVYRGSDGRYYCKRGDGTVGLVIGGAGGALLGNVIDGGRHRTAGTLIGGALGALIGKSVAEQQDLRCR